MRLLEMASANETTRLEAFSDGVIAVIITIMTFELRVPPGDRPGDLAKVVPGLVVYLLGVVSVAIYWNNHHHLLRARSIFASRSCGPICTRCSGCH